MSRISALLVEDNPDDARLIERILTRGLKNISVTCVDNLDDYKAQIEPEKTGSKLIASNCNIRDITNLQDVQKNFLDDYRQYASVFGFSRVPTLLINNRLCLLQVNLAASRLFDHDASDILGTNLLELLDAENKDAFAETFHEQMEGNADCAETELGFTRLDAEPVRCHVKTTVIRNAKKLPRLLLLEVTEP